MVKYKIGPKTHINPYNFISLDEDGCTKGKPRFGKHTGYIECELITKTETIIPGTIDNDERLLKFFNYGGITNGFIPPVIPGSELRGMLRSDYEIFTNSCLTNMNTEKIFLGRSSKPKKPGMLVKNQQGNWELYDAKRYRLPTTRRGKKDGRYLVDKNGKILINGNLYQTGDKIRFDMIKSNNSPVESVKSFSENGKLEGYVFIGAGEARKNDHIFTITKNKITVKDMESSFKGLMETVDAYENSSINKNKGNIEQWYPNYYKKGINHLPVWYAINQDNEVSLSPAAIGKSAYNRSVKDLITTKKNKDYTPCVNKNNICKACDLFGFVSEEDSKGSRIRISDATLVNKDINPYSDVKILHELSSPKTSNAAFYTRYYPNKYLGEEGFYWTYDDEVVGNDLYKIDNKDIMIRGRKVYWHHRPKNGTSYVDVLNERNNKAIPVKENTSFLFKVYFNDISEEQLKELVAVIELDSKTNKELYHKIGHGKPLGLGSVDLKVKTIKERFVDLDSDNPYVVKDINLDNRELEEVFDMTKLSMKEALRIYDFNYLKQAHPNSDVTYPYGNTGDIQYVGSLAWFILNSNQKARIKDHGYYMVLPSIMDGDVVINRMDHEFTIHGQEIPEFQIIPTRRR